MTNAEAQRREQVIDQAVAAGALERAEREVLAYLTKSGSPRPDREPARELWFRAAYLAAQVSLAAGRLVQTSERLAPCLAVAERLPQKLAARVHLVAAEALARLRRGVEARLLLERVPPSLLARHPLLHLRGLRIRLWLGEITQIEGEIVACSAALEARGDLSNRALLLCEEGCGRESAGDLDGAERCWQRAEALTRAPGPDPIRASVLLQLGRIDHLRGRLPSALERFGEALATAGAGPHALEVRLRHLLVLLDSNQWDRARLLADELPTGSPERLPEEVRPLAALLRAVLEGGAPAGATDEQEAYAAAARGDVSAARLLYLRALAATPSPERQARLALALGLLALGQGDQTDTNSWLRQAEKLSRDRGLPDLLWRALQARGRSVAELAGDEEAAIRLFEEAIVVCEVQAGLFEDSIEAAAYRRQCGGVLRQLLRAACRRGDPALVFRRQELDRGRLLLNLWRGSVARPELHDFLDRASATDLERRITACDKELLKGADSERQRAILQEREELKVRLDHLYLNFLRDRTRRGSAVLPALPDLASLQASLPCGALYLAPVLVDEELYLLAASREGPAQVIRAAGSASGLAEALEELRGCLTGQLARYRAGLPLGRTHRAELDARLEDLGRGPLGKALAQALASCPSPPRRLLWVPEGPLHGLPVAALRLGDRYLIEDVEVAWTFSGALLVHQAQTERAVRGPFRPALVVTESPAVLPEAASEGEGVAASFLWSRVLHGAAAKRAALRRRLARARVIHFACHAHFDNEHPLAAHVVLPSGETLGALDWLSERVDGLPLVTLSACRSAEVAPLLGREVFGLVTGLLGGGVRAVLAGLWPVADRETRPLMWRFYRHRLTSDLAAALAHAQREALADPDSSPLFWASFALFGDPAALPSPGFVGRWLGRWRRARHARRFPASKG
jgi:tetratricopeptide (TPR) repeat protein